MRGAFRTSLNAMPGQARDFFGHAHARAHISLKPVDHFAIFDFDAIDGDNFRFFGIQPRGFEVEGYEGMENGHVGFGFCWVSRRTPHCKEMGLLTPVC